jgi:hypothetical protein
MKSKPRQRLEGYCVLYSDYFADNPSHTSDIFWRSVRMKRKLFLDIMMAVQVYDPWFQCKNMIIESEREHPIHDTEPWQGSLAQVDHYVSAAFVPFIITMRLANLRHNDSLPTLRGSGGSFVDDQMRSLGFCVL